MSLQVPQTREGALSPELFKRYQRSEQSFVVALIEMVVQGASARMGTADQWTPARATAAPGSETERSRSGVALFGCISPVLKASFWPCPPLFGALRRAQDAPWL
ncbi:transposase [Accumulibacter sp.]|uniref:transposase n=1 Tax=Accumulibacter sp. TaxID=2053492 RepID=UPI0025F75881|nr:transposase [Accumulibacter sp.]MCM8626870.1 transposase [Accumulibacter sp.]